MMKSTLLCREQGITYDELWDQPKEFIDTMLLMLQNERAVADTKNKSRS